MAIRSPAEPTLSVDELSWDEGSGPPTPIFDRVAPALATLVEGHNAPLQGLTSQERKELCRELRAELIHSVAKTGGHLGSSLGVVELTVALHTVFDTPRDRIVWDVGHQAYIHKLLTGRRGRMNTVRQADGLSGFTKRAESDHDPFGAGHSSTSISAALGMAVGRDFKGGRNHCIAVIGDGAITGGMAYEAMNHAGFLDSNVIVILNDNQQVSLPTQYNSGGQRPVGALSGALARLQASKPLRELREVAKKATKRMPVPVQVGTAKLDEYARGMISGSSSSLFEELGLYYIGPLDGHDLAGLEAVLEEVKTTEAAGPVLIHIMTEKGRGYSAAEDASDKMHGVVKFDPVTGRQFKGGGKSYTSYFADALTAEARRDARVVAIHAAMGGGTGLNAFEKWFPDRTFDVGIAEQHAVTFAAGLACEGLVPVCAIYSTFLQRAFDQVAHDVALQKLPVRFMMDRAGLVGADGSTHGGMFDVGYMAMLPGMVVMASSDEAELVNMVATCVAYDAGPSCLRYPRGNGRGVDLAAAGVTDVGEGGLKGTPLPIGKGIVRRWGREGGGKLGAAGSGDVAILAYGSSVVDAMDAADVLASRGVAATVADARFCKPLDEDLVRQLAASHGRVVVVEEGAVGGFGSHVLQFMALDGHLDGTNADVCGPAGTPVSVRPMVCPDRWIDHGTQQEQLQWAGLDAIAIAATALRVCGREEEAKEYA